MPKLPTPNLLEVERSDGTLVMDCDSGIALILVDRDRRSNERNQARPTASEDEQMELHVPVPKRKSGPN